jgi:hypothetical protein
MLEDVAPVANDDAGPSPAGLVNSTNPRGSITLSLDPTEDDDNDNEEDDDDVDGGGNDGVEKALATPMIATNKRAPGMVKGDDDGMANPNYSRSLKRPVYVVDVQTFYRNLEKRCRLNGSRGVDKAMTRTSSAIGCWHLTSQRKKIVASLLAKKNNSSSA